MAVALGFLIFLKELLGFFCLFVQFRAILAVMIENVERERNCRTLCFELLLLLCYYCC